MNPRAQNPLDNLELFFYITNAMLPFPEIFFSYATKIDDEETQNNRGITFDVQVVQIVWNIVTILLNVYTVSKLYILEVEKKTKQTSKRLLVNHREMRLRGRI